MNRFVVNAVTIASLLVAAASVVAWGASDRNTWAVTQMKQIQDPFVLPGHSSPVAKYRILMLMVSRRRVLASYQHYVSAAGVGSPDWEFVRVDKPPVADAGETSFRLPWFKWNHEKNALGEFEYSVTVPLWFVVMSTMVIPVARVVRHKRASQLRKPACCLKCGYDLRASPDRCPECGTPVQPPLHEAAG